MLSVDSSARAIITEVRLQFAQCPQLMMRPGQTEEEYQQEFEARQINDINDPNDGKLRGDDGNYYPDTNRCVQIATDSAIQEMVLPGFIAVFSPPVVGFLLGSAALAGMLVGSLGSGFMLALTMSNAGGAWDNAKKWVERCASEGSPEKDGSVTYTMYGVKKGAQAREIAGDIQTIKQLLKEEDESPVNDEQIEALVKKMVKLYKDRHDPVVVGDTVGDPFKDTSGPALNILIKLMSVISLVLAPTLKKYPASFDELWWVGLIVLILVSGFCYYAVSYFNKKNTERSNAAIQLKKEADARFAGAASPLVIGGTAADDVEAGVKDSAVVVGVEGDAEETAEDAPATE
jgi:hypothetical protein